ncbi:hypothetical protein M422DRAFT_248466 [Sphaerobolus stellatus SS14]|uniref:Uncharacterized protein n=1 Tax=Sphaerobolus stellatus (strain SS14) TaxID=990650 RepID=A0A0C9VVX3_SPHS4|nr:hypothetical protein M422DRAFT_248466 [Sphaerobolus stellatus SS14]
MAQEDTYNITLFPPRPNGLRKVVLSSQQPTWRDIAYKIKNTCMVVNYNNVDYTISSQEELEVYFFTVLPLTHVQFKVKCLEPTPIYSANGHPTLPVAPTAAQEVSGSHDSEQLTFVSSPCYSPPESTVMRDDLRDLGGKPMSAHEQLAVYEATMFGIDHMITEAFNAVRKFPQPEIPAALVALGAETWSLVALEAVLGVEGAAEPDARHANTIPVSGIVSVDDDRGLQDSVLKSS